jgi:hypothetical protein
MNASEVFLTHKEFEGLFGAEISAVTRVLNKACAERCSACGGKCCRDIGCRLYSEKFRYCPIYDIRPRECRYHFCHDIFEGAPLSKEEKELLQRPINEFFGGDRERLARLFPLFPMFPLSSEGLDLLGIKEDVDVIMDELVQGRVDENKARRLLTSVCRQKVRQQASPLLTRGKDE